MRGAKRFHRIDFRYVEIGQLITDLPRRTALEDQFFVLRDVLADFANHVLVRTRESPGEMIHLLPLRHLGRAKKHRVIEFGIEAREWKTADDLLT